MARRALAATVVLLLAASGFTAAYPRQVRAYLTHWKGSPTHTVAYAPPDPAHPPEVRLAVVGDIGVAGTRVRRTAAAVSEAAGASGFDALLLLGDNVYPVGDPGGLDATVFRPFQPLLDDGTRLLAILGNHDIKDGNGPAQLAALGVPGPWWSTELGDVLLVGLDSNRAADPEQRRWLVRTLEESEQTWRIALLHHPPYSAGYQGSSNEAREAFAPLFTRYGVQLVLAGHDHDYQRSKPIDGVTYVVTGAAAETRRTGSRSFTAVSFAWHHFVEVDIYPERIVGRAVNQDLRVADTWVLRP